MNIPRSGNNRKLRNFLLNAPLQLRLTAYVMASTLLVTGFLGAFLWSETKTVVRSAAVITEQRLKTAEMHRELARATLAAKISDVANMDWSTANSQLAEINNQYAKELVASQAEQNELAARQSRVRWILFGGLFAFIVAIFLGSIVITHRIAGPLFRFHRMADEVISGKLRVPRYGLRRGDQMKDFFATFTTMIETMRARESDEVRALNEAIELAKKTHAPSDLLEKLRAIEAGKRDRLDLERPVLAALADSSTGGRRAS